MRFNSFSVEDRPGMQWITLKGKFGGTEDIKIEATMFDGCKSVPKLGDDSDGEEDLRLHSSVLVDISKRDGSDYLEFVCSAWPDSLEIQKLYVLKRDRMLSRPYMGPDFRYRSSQIQSYLSFWSGFGWLITDYCPFWSGFGCHNMLPLISDPC